MTQIALVHGAWGGAWIWRHVLPGLRAAGHVITGAADALAGRVKQLI